MKEFCSVARISNNNRPREEFTLDNTCLVRKLSRPSAVLHHTRPQYKYVVRETLVCTLKRQCELHNVFMFM